MLDEFLAAMFARLDPQAPVNQDLHRIVADADHAIAEWTTTATTRDGRMYRNDYAAVFRMEGTVIVEVREHFDTACAQQLMFSSASATDTRPDPQGSLDRPSARGWNRPEWRTASERLSKTLRPAGASGSSPRRLRVRGEGRADGAT